MKVAVIMSTYNGQKFLSEQIESILNQESVEVELFIRDDGSMDRTTNILRDYQNKYLNVHIKEGCNKGFRRSFMMQLCEATGFEYYAFSDQDDFWEKNKLINAYKCIKIKEEQASKKPIVYYSNLDISDENLNIYRKTHLENRKKNIESLIMRRSIAGCTMVFNQNMWKHINSVEIKDEMLRRGHDSFILSLCYAIGGDVICDSNTYIRYRQHGENTSGSSYSLLQRFKKEWNILVNKRGDEPAIAQSILDNWGESISPEIKIKLELISNSAKLLNRVRIVCSSNFTTGDIRLTIIGKIRAFLGLL